MPTRVLIIWSDVMCSTIGELTSAQGDLAGLWSVSRRRNSVRWQVLVPLT
ncbi:hypothetical protein OHA70_06595 [Kribbella sp. NBC_00382]